MKKKEIFKKVAGWVIYIGVLIVLIWLTPKVMSLALDSEYPMASITSSSMWPTLQRGDLVLIKGVSSADDIEIGDIIIYRNPKGFTIHRVIEKKLETLVTKGDANNITDSPIEYKDIVGKALTYKEKLIRIPYLGNISLLFKDKF